MVEVKERPKTRRRADGRGHTIRKVGVIGAGQMGSGIAHVCALAGFDVLLNDVAADRIKAGLPPSTATWRARSAASASPRTSARPRSSASAPAETLEAISPTAIS